MRVGTMVGVGFLLLGLVAPASAVGPEFHVLGGLVMANLGGDAEEFGDAVASSIQSEVGGSWRSTKKIRLGFDFGVGASFSTSGVAGGAVELHYATRGAKYDITEVGGSGQSGTMTLKLDYVELPVLLQLSPPVTGSVRPVFVAGPVLGFKALSKVTADSQGSSQTEDLDNMKSVAVSGLIGAGIKVKATPLSSVLLQARFQFGLSNLVDDPDFSTTSRDVSILAGWSFSL